MLIGKLQKKVLIYRYVLILFFKGQLFFVRIYKYLNFGGFQVVLVNKSFFKVDDVQMKWNKIGIVLFVLIFIEFFDKSYYGD